MLKPPAAKPVLNVIALLSLFLFTACSHKQKGTIYMIRYNSSGWQTDVTINGVPTLHVDKGGGQVPISNLVTNGENTIEISAKLFDARLERFDFNLLAVNLATGEETILVDGPEPTTNNGVISVNAAATFDAKVPMQWTWERASVVTNLTPADEAEIFRLIQSLGSSLKSKDLKSHNQLRSVYIADSAKSDGVSESEIQKEFKDAYEPIFAAKSFAVQIRPRAQLVMRACGRITAMNVLASPWEDWIIRMNSDDEHLNYDVSHLLFSKLDGQWRFIN